MHKFMSVYSKEGIVLISYITYECHFPPIKYKNSNNVQT